MLAKSPNSKRPLYSFWSRFFYIPYASIGVCLHGLTSKILANCSGHYSLNQVQTERPGKECNEIVKYRRRITAADTSNSQK